MEKVNDSFGEYIRGLRKKKGYTLVQLSKESGVSNPYLSQIENDKFTPSIDILRKLANPLGVSVLTLMFNAGYANQDEVELVGQTDNLLKGNQWHKDEDYFYDSSDKKGKSKELNGITSLMNMNFRSVVNNSEDMLLNEVETTIIREHLSDMLLEYKKIIQAYRGAKINWGSFKEGLIADNKNDLDLKEIKELYFKKRMDDELEQLADKVRALPMWLTHQPSFLRADSIKKRLGEENKEDD